MIEPFFFDQDLLYGCFHPAASSDASRLLIVCPPFFDEYKRTHQALFELANACAQQGVNVLRFDYFGTGDSQGLLNEASVAIWQNNILAAIEEGIALSGAEDVILLGVRFGASLASQTVHPEIKRCVFWDPIPDGRYYLECINEGNRLLEQEHRLLARDMNVPFAMMAYENFLIAATLQREIAAVTFNQKAPSKTTSSYIITTNPLVYEQQLYANCEFPGLSYDWPAFQDSLFAPAPVLEAIGRRIIQ